MGKEFFLNGRSVCLSEAKAHFINYASNDLGVGQDEAVAMFEGAVYYHKDDMLDHLMMSGLEIAQEGF